MFFHCFWWKVKWLISWLFLLQITRVKGTDRVPLLLVGNKVDLEHQREVATMEGLALAQAWNCPFIEASARNKMNVNEVFAEIVREMNCNPAKEKRPYCCCNLLWESTIPAKRKIKKNFIIFHHPVLSLHLSCVSSFVACVSAWMPVGTMWRGRGPFNEQKLGKMCSVKRETDEDWSSWWAPCRGEMALHIKSLVKIFIRDRLPFFCTFDSSFFFSVYLFPFLLLLFVTSSNVEGFMSGSVGFRYIGLVSSIP